MIFLLGRGGGSPSESAGHLPTEIAFANEIARRIDEKLTFFNEVQQINGNVRQPAHAQPCQQHWNKIQKLPSAFGDRTCSPQNLPALGRWQRRDRWRIALMIGCC